ncbi:FAM83 family protein [bacterium]|nr:FAM83 family protein [bacterium]
MANGNENLEQRVIDVINAAHQSIDLTSYELNSLNIVVALCRAHERGVRVRIIFDDEAAPKNNSELWKTARQLLEKRYKIPIMSDAGWPWVQSKANYYKGHRAQMHHKFLIADYLSPDSTDDVVITGSYNFTITGLVSMQNMIQVQSRALAKIYTEEFEIMWGGSSSVPDTSAARFHQYKNKVSSNRITLNGTMIDAYFTPMNLKAGKTSFLDLLADLVTKETQHDIKICAFSFSTGIEIDEAIKEKFDKKGLDLKAVFEPSLGKQYWSLYSAMTQNEKSKKPWEKKAEAYLAVEDRHLHHKYILIDAENPDTNDIPIVITGSLNFSKNANEVNDDNFLIIRDRKIVNQYLQEFYARFIRAKDSSKSIKASDEMDDGNIED